MSNGIVAKLAKKALKILGDTEVSHRWDCQVDGHATIASNVAILLNKAKTEDDLRKVLRKINKKEFDCETDSHFEIMSDISELLAEGLEKQQKEDLTNIDPSIKHFVECGSDKNPNARKTSPVVKGKSRKCCKFCIQISKDTILHADCCDGKPHGHFKGLGVDNSRGPTKLSRTDEIDNRNGYGEQCPIGTVITARYLVGKLKISQTV